MNSPEIKNKIFHIAIDPRLKEVKKFQQENSEVVKYLAEIAAKRNDTPFDDSSEFTNCIKPKKRTYSTKA